MMEFGAAIGFDGISPRHEAAAVSGGHTFKPPRYIEGIGVKFLKAHIWKGNVDIFMPGCTVKSIESKRVIRLCVDHDNSTTLASTAAGTLELHAEDRGVAFRARLPDTVAGTAAFQEVISGARASMSPGYEVKAAEFVEVDGYRVRVIREIDLVEISLCKSGAVPTTFAAIVVGTDTAFTESFWAMESKGAVVRIRRAFAGIASELVRRMV
jgi:HK97 family phage prohead protease